MKLSNHAAYQQVIDELNSVIPTSPTSPTAGTEKQVKYACDLLDKASQMVGVLILTRWSTADAAKKENILKSFAAKKVESASKIIEALDGMSGEYAPALLSDVRRNAGGSAMRLTDSFAAIQKFMQTK